MRQQSADAVMSSPHILRPHLQPFCFSFVTHAGMRALLISLYLLAQMSSSKGALGNHKAQVVRITATSNEDVNFVRQLRNKFNLDTWRDLRQANTTGDFLIPSQLSGAMRNFLKLHGIPFTVIIDDTARFISEHERREGKKRYRRTTTEARYRYRYLTYDQMNDFLARVQKEASAANIQIGFIGKSFEGRDTPYVKITSKRDPRPKSAIVIDGGIHSREWISPALALEIIHRLVINAEQDSQVEQLLDMFDFIVVPLVNPDGYAYTFLPGVDIGARSTPARLWRKSRTSNYSRDLSCYGVDINRNFGYKWNDNPSFGGSSNPCSPSYSGPYSFSEPESQNLRRLLLHYKDAIKGYLSLHSFGQYLLYPWGYRQDAEIEDEPDLVHVARAFKDTMRRKNYHYHVGGSAKSLYPAAGGSSDYVKGVIGVKYSYTIELPPVEDAIPWGFILPESKVKSVVTDTWAGIKALLFRLHNYTAGRSERLKDIAVEMEKRLRSDNVKDTKRKTENVKEKVYIANSDVVPSIKNQRLQTVLGFEEKVEDNMTEKNKAGGRAMYEDPVSKNTIYDTSTSNMENMKSGSAKLWSIGDILRFQYNYFNSYSRK